MLPHGSRRKPAFAVEDVLALPGRLAFAETGQKAPDPLFGHEEGCGEGIGPDLGELLPVGGPAESSPAQAVEEDMRVLVDAGEPPAQEMVAPVPDHQQAQPGLHQGQSGDILRQVDGRGAHALLFQKIHHISEMTCSRDRAGAARRRQSGSPARWPAIWSSAASPDSSGRLPGHGPARVAPPGLPPRSPGPRSPGPPREPTPPASRLRRLPGKVPRPSPPGGTREPESRGCPAHRGGTSGRAPGRIRFDFRAPSAPRMDARDPGDGPRRPGSARSAPALPGDGRRVPVE